MLNFDFHTPGSNIFSRPRKQKNDIENAVEETSDIVGGSIFKKEKIRIDYKPSLKGVKSNNIKFIVR